MLSTFRNFLRSLDRSPLAWLIAIAGALIFALMLPAAMGLTYGDHTLREFWDWKNILFVILTLFTLSQWKISRWFVAIPLVLILAATSGRHSVREAQHSRRYRSHADNTG